MKVRFRLRRIISFLIIILLLIFIVRPVCFLVYTHVKDGKATKNVKHGSTNDASQLNETKVETIIRVPQDSNTALLQISSLIKQAIVQKKKISIAGAQHSMGGHTIYPDAIVLNMKSLRYMKFDSARDILSVGSGALWSEIIPYLDKFGKSIGVMQSNNSFSVGGSISVNCHGWQPNAPPIASTIESFRIVNADGDILTCSRNENKELFSLVLGGYGLFGVVVDVELRVVNNKMYKTHQYIIKSRNYVEDFNRLVTADPGIGLAYGRININPENFLEEAILSTYNIDSSSLLHAVKENRLKTLRRVVFRSSVNSEYGKNLRWKIEKLSTSLVNGRRFTRNQLFNEGVEIYQNNDADYTDILHEYFIPRNSFSRFIDSLKNIIPAYKVDLLNITVRNVSKDGDTYLVYADEEVFGFVMLFNQSKNSVSENEMRKLTQRLVDVSIALNGTYYLPYRLHATKEQMYKAYPSAPSFFALKKKYDPHEVFVSKFYESYK